MKNCKCKKGCCKRKGHKGCKRGQILPILALLTCFGLLAPKKVKSSVPGKALKYALAFAWGGIALHTILRVYFRVRKHKKHRK